MTNSKKATKATKATPRRRKARKASKVSEAAAAAPIKGEAPAPIKGEDVGISPERWAKIWSAEKQILLIPVADADDEMILRTPTFEKVKEGSAQVYGGRKVNLDNATLITIVRGILKEAQDRYDTYQFSDAVAPIFEALNALGYTHNGMMDLYERPLEAKDGWTPPTGGLFGSPRVSECFKLANKAGTEHKGHLVARLNAEGICSLTLPSKRKGKRKASGAPRAPKFGWADYGKLVGYGDPLDPKSEEFSRISERLEGTEDGNGFVVSIEQDEETNVYEFCVDVNAASGKLVLRIHTYRADGSPAPVVQCTEGKKADLVQDEELYEVSAPSKMTGAAGIGGNRSPKQQWSLDEKISDIESEAEAEETEETEAVQKILSPDS